MLECGKRLMKHIGVLTVINCDNNGTDIQAYAMQRLFERLDPNVELIDYRAIRWEKQASGRPLSLTALIKQPIRSFMHRVHHSFRQNNWRVSSKQYTVESLNNLPYDKVVVGSDQIWNLDITEGDKGFFLPDEKVAYKKYSYAVSLGKKDITDWEQKYGISGFLRPFLGISVREKSGVEALGKIGIEARQDLDPVLMVGKDCWEHMAVSQELDRYILVYLAQANREALEYAVRLAQEQQCKVIWITDSIKKHKNIICKRFVGVEQWIGYIKNAQMVITNSYHGLAMSIALNTCVCVMGLRDKPQSSARMLDLLDILDMPFAIWRSDKQFADYLADWNAVNTRLSALRDKSMKYIQGVIGNDGED